MKRLKTSGVVALLAAAASCGGPPPGAGAMFQRPPAPVTATAAVSRDVPRYLDEIGKCSALEYVSIVPQVTGLVVGRSFKDGDELHKGDQLFTIDARPYKATLDQALANQRQSQAAVEFAKLEYDRMKGLVASKAISQEDYDIKKNALDVAGAQLEAADAAVATAKLNLEYCTIVSPIDGRAGLRLVDVGNVVKANEGSLLVVQRLDSIYADFTITERDLPAVLERFNESRAGQAGAGASTQPVADTQLVGDAQLTAATRPAVADAATAQTRPSEQASGATQASGGPSTQPAFQVDPYLKVLVKLPGEPGEGRERKLTFVDTGVQDGAGTVKLRATISNADRHFWPGEFVQARLILKTEKGAVLVPQSAVQVGQTGPFVYVLKGDAAKGGATAQIRPVKPGQPQGEMVVVENGVKPGEMVITSGQMAVTPDGPVNVLPPEGGPTTAPAGPAQAGGGTPEDEKAAKS